MAQVAFRFLVGGFVVSLFAALGDAVKPKSFAGLFGAAPSVALATIGLTIAVDGKPYASIEARSMIVGAAAFCLYACICCRLMAKRFQAAPVATLALIVWLACALAAWDALIR